MSARPDTSHHDRVAAAFDAHAPSWTDYYDSDGGFRHHSLQTRRAYVLEPILATPPGRVLDLGCGSGAYVGPLLEAGWDVSCLDTSTGMLAQVEQRYADALGSRLHTAQGTVEAPPHPSAAFDAVICAGVLEYVSDPSRVLAEIRRVLKPGGVAVVTIPNVRSPFALIDRVSLGFARGVGWLLDRAGLFERMRKHPRAGQLVRHRLFALSAFRPKLRRAGFRVHDVRFCSFGSFAFNNWPGAVAISRWCERWQRHRWLSRLGVTAVLTLRAVDPSQPGRDGA